MAERKMYIAIGALALLAMVAIVIHARWQHTDSHCGLLLTYARTNTDQHRQHHRVLNQL